MKPKQPEKKKQINLHIEPSEYTVIQAAMVSEITQTGKPVNMSNFIRGKVLELFGMKGGK